MKLLHACIEHEGAPITDLAISGRCYVCKRLTTGSFVMVMAADLIQAYEQLRQMVIGEPC